MSDNQLLLIIGAGPDQVPAYQIANAMGVRTIALDMNRQAPAMRMADYSIVESTRNIPAVVAKVRDFSKRLWPVSGVMTIAAEVSPTVAAVASALGLPGVSEEVACLTTNKCARAQRFKEKGVNFPDFWVGNRFADFNSVHFPAVIKPSDNSASRGVRLVNNQHELLEYFDTAVSLASDKTVILEKYIAGPQVSIEGVMVNNKFYITGFADRNYARNKDFYPCFVEDGSDAPSGLPPDVIGRINVEFEKAVRAVGIESGPSKGDIVVDEVTGRVYVLEVTSRLSGGGFCSRNVPLSTGVNIVQTTIELALGLPVDMDNLQPRFNRAVCHRFFFHQPGVIEKIVGLDDVGQMPGIADFVIQRSFEVGDVLEPVTYANRLFYVVAIADTSAQAVEYAAQAIASVKIEVE